MSDSVDAERQIGVATGMLMVRDSISRAEAAARLQRVATAAGTDLVTAARAIVERMTA